MWLVVSEAANGVEHSDNVTQHHDDWSPPEHPCNNRFAAGGIRITANSDENITCLSDKTFRFQARHYYNQIPGEIRQLGKSKFKKASLKWVKEVIPIR